MFIRHRPKEEILLPFPHALGLKRFYGSGDLHFITCSCHRRRPLLASFWRRDLFLRVLEEVRQRYSFVVVAYVVMPEHFHLLISEPDTGTPSKLRYIHRNPVRCGLVQNPEDWPWSSFRAYAYSERGR